MKMVVCVTECIRCVATSTSYHTDSDFGDETSLVADDETDEEAAGEKTTRYGHDYSRHISRDEQLPRQSIATNTSPRPEQWREVTVTPVQEHQPMTYLERLWTTGTVREY